VVAIAFLTLLRLLEEEEEEAILQLAEMVAAEVEWAQLVLPQEPAPLGKGTVVEHPFIILMALVEVVREVLAKMNKCPLAVRVVVE
jgi:hypothetical protein